ncbi:unnamed protein product [Caenorhabditis auriculariae]|uniref:Uncharacterized protein n=1 Tax=Caenorhabditis auriculariae TaxID=2777116 RepID=A0A8S1GP19_9PELO|nr:unnamed protein product [Caenorhabditis auriculariae]
MRTPDGRPLSTPTAGNTHPDVFWMRSDSTMRKLDDFGCQSSTVIMPDSLTAPSVKSGNVLALLNTLYTSGFAMASSSTPLLKGRTLHALYAISFIVYVTNCVCDWLHVCFTIKGYVTSFPLNMWLAIALVATAVIGTMFTWLLLVLCVENAFAHRLDITPYRSGCALVFENFIEWTQAFNNFRVSFLIMLLHDAPMTIFNYFFIAACRCPNPKVGNKFRRMVCAKTPKKNVTGVSVNPPALQHFRAAIDTSSASQGGRLNEMDETWPIRWSRLKTLGPHPERTREEVIANGETNGMIEAKKVLIFEDSYDVYRFPEDIPKMVLQGFWRVVWILLSSIVYVGACLVCCLPCLYHYTCRHNSFYHRHKFCRNFIRYVSQVYHYTIFYSSLVLSVILIFLNIVLLTSVHGLGSNSIPPEIDKVCVTVSPQSRKIFIGVLPAPVFKTQSEFHKILNRRHAASDPYATTNCKPLWEDGGLGFGLARAQAGVWQMRTPAGPHMIAVATQVLFNHTDSQYPYLELRFEHAFFYRAGTVGTEKFQCIKNNAWSLITPINRLPWPYFSACQQNWDFVETRLISCDHYFIRRPRVSRRHRFP